MPKFSNEIVQFANGDTTFFEAFSDYYFHWNSEVKNEKLGYFDNTRSLSEKSDKIQKAFFAQIEKMSGVKRTDDNANAWASNPQVQWACFALVDAVINSILPATINPSIGIFTDMRYVSYGDIVKYTIKPRSLFTVSRGAHGERTTNRQKQYSGDLLISPIEHIVTTFVDMYRVLAGKEDIAEFVRLVVLSIETEMSKDATNALTTGLAYGTYPGALSVQGAFSPEALVTLAETVQAYNFGVRPVILGPRTALMKVVPDSTLGYRFVVEGKEGMVGLVRDFYGFDLMVMPQYATGDYSNYGLALDPDTLYIVAPGLDKLVKGVVSNTLTNSNQFYDNADLTQNFSMRKDWDFVFASASVGGMYKITD